MLVGLERVICRGAGDFGLGLQWWRAAIVPVVTAVCCFGLLLTDLVVMVGEWWKRGV